MKNFSFCKDVSCYPSTSTLVIRNAKRQNCQKFYVLFFLFFVLSGFLYSLNAASIYFNTVYIGSGTSYTLNTNSIISISPVVGNGFKFTSTNPTDVQFISTGNNVNGTFSYINTSGVIITKTGIVSRIYKTGNTTDGLYFLVDGTGVAYNLVIPGREGQFVSGSNYNSAGNSALADMNALLAAQAPQAVVSISDATATEGDSYINFTVSFSNNSSRTVTNIFTPYITDNTASATTDLTLPIQYSFNGTSWTNLTSNISVASTQATVQIRIAVTDDATPEIDETFTLNTGTFSGVGILNSAGTYGTGIIKDNNDPIVWTGAVSNLFNNASNWSPAILPQTSFSILIPGSLSRYPTLSQNTQMNGLTIASGASLSLSTYNAELSGNLINNGTLTATTGSIFLNGSSAQTISGAGSIANLNITNTNGVVVSSGNTNMQSITGVLTVQSGTFNTNGNITLKCVTNIVACVAPVTGIITGNVTVERCIPAGKRSYRFLTPVVTTTTSIHNNWQEGATAATHNPNSGYGTHITGTLVDQTNGLDATSTGNPSLYVFNNSTQSWSTITNTNVNSFNAGSAYRIMLRGDRSVDLTTQPSTNSATILRTAGSLTTGTITFGTASSIPSNMPKLAANPNEFSFIGNPYASAIDWSTLTKNGITGYYYIWDPTIASRGAYISCFTDGVRSNQSSNINTAIQLGQGFFVKNTTVNESRQLVITEANKVNICTNVFRTQNTSAIIKTQLYLSATYAAGGSAQDGTVVLLNNNYSNDVNDDDAYKLTNQDENIAVQRSSNLMSIERRRLSFAVSDTIRFKMWQMTANAYTLKFEAANFDNNVVAYLYDAFNNTSTPINLSATTEMNFTITNNTASSNENRFSIVLRNNSTLPVTFVSVNATQKSNGINLDWKVANEINLSSYEVEKSIEGLVFKTISNISAENKSTYSYTDVAAINGINYYRIKALDKNGTIQYSSIVGIKISKQNTPIFLLNNPVKNKTLLLQFNDASVGTYSIQLFNNAGQLIEKKQIQYNGGVTIEKIDFQNAVNGIYHLEVSGASLKISKSVVLN